MTLDGLGGGQVGEEVPRRLLPHEADHLPAVLGPLVLGEERQVHPRDLDPAGRRRVDAAEDVLKRRLAAPRGADHVQVPEAEISREPDRQNSAVMQVLAKEYPRAF